MAEALVNLVFLVLMFLAVIACIFAPLAAIGIILWNWRAGTNQLGKSRRAYLGSSE
jgi:hypothetical protein